MYEANSWYEFLAVGLGTTIVFCAAYVLGAIRHNKATKELVDKHYQLKIAIIKFLMTAQKLPLDRDEVKERLRDILDLIKEDFDEDPK